jgi:DNA mismatch repair protein MutH
MTASQMSKEGTRPLATLIPLRRPPPVTLRELVVRAEALEGHSVAQVARALQMPLPAEPARAKGFVGTLLEHALGADPEAADGPDFPQLGVELKSIPLGSCGRPAESTFVCSIRMADAALESWESSRLRRRLARVLFVPIEAARVRPLAARRFGRALLWVPPPADEALLRADWEDLMGAIGAGRAGTLTAREGCALQVRPKASTSSVRRLAPGPDGPQRSLPLGFYLRAKFTARVLAESRG